jgi:hypothetical protein
MQLRIRRGIGESNMETAMEVVYQLLRCRIFLDQLIVILLLL